MFSFRNIFWSPLIPLYTEVENIFRFLIITYIHVYNSKYLEKNKVLIAEKQKKKFKKCLEKQVSIIRDDLARLSISSVHSSLFFSGGIESVADPDMTLLISTSCYILTHILPTPWVGCIRYVDPSVCSHMGLLTAASSHSERP